jgi:secondary thiamine-phosphate synthase enzyme
MVLQKQIVLKPYPLGFHLITEEIVRALQPLPNNGILHLFLQHTSAALTINENADYTVRKDFETFFSQLVPENFKHFVHTLEGSDDMPAHIKSSIIGQSISIPIVNNKLALGTWQGIYLCEFRRHSYSRKILASIIS